MMAILKSLYSRFENLINGCLKENIVFLHFPKCGGNSVGAAIHDRYKTFAPRGGTALVNINAEASLKAASRFYGTDNPFTDDYRHILKYREYLLVYFMGLDTTRYIDGHVGFSDLAYQEFKDKYAFITVLRNPVKRWISAFFYNRYRQDCDWKINDGLLEYLDSPRSRANGWEYVKKLQGEMDSDLDYTSSEAIEKAKNNLEKFTIVGFLEDLGDFRRKFRNRFGVDLRIGRINTGPKSTDYVNSILTDDIEERIWNICRPDLAVYQHALENCRGSGPTAPAPLSLRLRT